MPNLNLLKEIKVTRVLNAVAAGTTNQTSSTIDMESWDGVMFVASFGTLTGGAVTNIYARQGQQSGMGDAADLAGTKVSIPDTDSNKVLVLDVFRPAERYVNCIVGRATANAVIDGVVAIQYKGRVTPSVQPATVSASKLSVSPDEGTP
jgi:hypothetical protein